MQTRAKITSKGQITVPLKIRKALGVKEGDQLVFDQNGGEVVVRPLKRLSKLEKYRGIGTPGISAGRKAVIRSVRELRDPE